MDTNKIKKIKKNKVKRSKVNEKNKLPLLE